MARTKKTEDGESTQSKSTGVGRVSVPGLKASKGVKEWRNPDAGPYRMVCTKVELKESQKSPGFNWIFNWKIISGPKQADGSDPKGLPVKNSVFIMGEKHPSFEQWGHLGVDELKSICLATGVSPRGDDINPESFIDQTADVVLDTKEEKSNKFDEDGNAVMFDKVYVKKWKIATAE
jgi:hypothetical protein